MVLLVQGEQDLRVREELVEALTGIEPRLLRQRDRELADDPERLDLLAALVQPALTASCGMACGPLC